MFPSRLLGPTLLTGLLALSLLGQPLVMAQEAAAGRPPGTAARKKPAKAPKHRKPSSQRIVRPAPAAVAPDTAPAVDSAQPPGPPAGARTSLVVDARGSRLTRGMGPRIYSSSGELVYGDFESNWEYAQQWGVVTYCEDLQEALQLPVTGANPLVVKAAAVSPDESSDLVLDDATAADVLEAATNWDFLKYQRVIIVLDN